jgi:hypothetical protein
MWVGGQGKLVYSPQIATKGLHKQNMVEGGKHPAFSFLRLFPCQGTIIDALYVTNLRVQGLQPLPFM